MSDETAEEAFRQRILQGVADTEATRLAFYCGAIYVMLEIARCPAGEETKVLSALNGKFHTFAQAVIKTKSDDREHKEVSGE